jgi:hypothetical protein
MPDGAYRLPEAVIEPALLDPAIDVDSIEDARLVARLQQRVEKGRLNLQMHVKHLQQLLVEIEAENFSADDLTRLAQEALTRERATVELFHPGASSLEEKLASNERLRAPDALPYFEEALKISAGWSAAWHRLYEGILTLAEVKRGARARPGKGTVDWAELSREHIARYPKIRARLAE